MSLSTDEIDTLANALRNLRYFSLTPRKLAELLLMDGHVLPRKAWEDAFDAGVEQGKSLAYAEGVG